MDALTRQDKPVSQRRLRVGEEIRHALADILMRRELRDPDMPADPPTVTEVRVSPDLKNATVFFTPLGPGNAETRRKIAAALQRAEPFLRRRLGSVARLRYAPALTFRYDDSFDTAGRIDGLLRRAAER